MNVGVAVGEVVGVSLGAAVGVGVGIGGGGGTTSKIILRTVLPPLLVTSTVTVSRPGESGAVYMTDDVVEDERLPLAGVHSN